MPFFVNMERLLTNTASQTLRLTLNEGKQYFSTTFTNYLLVIYREEKSDTGLMLAQVPTVVSDTQRITVLTVTTVGLTTPGTYRYFAYGQNSSVNLDPENASVVGMVEEGQFQLYDNEVYFSQPDLTIPNDEVNGES